MDMILENQYIYEKEIFSKLIIDTELQEIIYSETFNLIFYRIINNSKEDSYRWIIKKLNLIIDAPFWVGTKSAWEELMKKKERIIWMDDTMLAYKLVDIRYHNLIHVHKVEFFEKYLCIELDDENILLIGYYSESDYSWILEEYCSEKDIQDKMMVFCQGNMLVAKNISNIL